MKYVLSPKTQKFSFDLVKGKTVEKTKKNYKTQSFHSKSSQTPYEKQTKKIFQRSKGRDNSNYIIATPDLWKFFGFLFLWFFLMVLATFGKDSLVL